MRIKQEIIKHYLYRDGDEVIKIRAFDPEQIQKHYGLSTNHLRKNCSRVFDNNKDVDVDLTK